MAHIYIYIYIRIESYAEAWAFRARISQGFFCKTSRVGGSGFRA